MASEATLSPCPFCGSAARIERYGNNRMSTIYRCDECGCSLETGETFNHGARWNARAALDAAAAVDGDAQTMDDVLREAEAHISRIAEKHNGHMQAAHTGVAEALSKLRLGLRGLK